MERDYSGKLKGEEDVKRFGQYQKEMLKYTIRKRLWASRGEASRGAQDDGKEHRNNLTGTSVILLHRRVFPFEKKECEKEGGGEWKTTEKSLRSGNLEKGKRRETKGSLHTPSRTRLGLPEKHKNVRLRDPRGKRGKSVTLRDRRTDEKGGEEKWK